MVHANILTTSDLHGHVTSGDEDDALMLIDAFYDRAMRETADVRGR